MLFLWRNLPVNAKALLKLNAGGDHSEIEGIQLMQHYIGSKTSMTQGQNGGSRVTAGKNNSKSETNKSDEISLPVAILTNQGTPIKMHVKPGTTGGLVINGFEYPINDKNKQGLGLTTLDNLINNSVVHGIFDWNNIFMGNQSVDFSGASKIVVNATDLVTAYLPFDIELASKGIWKPNFNYLKVLDTVRDEI